jgi:hypothetical protein
MALTEEEKQRVIDALDELDLELSKKVLASEESRPFFKLEFNWGKAKPQNPNQPPSDNNPSQEKKS